MGTSCRISGAPAAFADSNLYTSNFGTDANGCTAAGGAVAGDIDAIGGQDDTLRLTIDGGDSTHSIKLPAASVAGNTYRIQFYFYIPAAQSNIDGIRLLHNNGATAISAVLTDTNAWTPADYYFTATNTAASGLAFGLYAYDGAAVSFQDAGADDVMYIKSVVIDRWTRDPNV